MKNNNIKDQKLKKNIFGDDSDIDDINNIREKIKKNSSFFV